MPSAFGLPEDQPDMVQLVLAPYQGPWEIGEHLQSRVVPADCGHRAWVSPRGERYMGTVTTICTRCFVAAGGMTPDAGTLKMMVAGTMNSLREQFGDDFADEARRFARDHGIEEH